MKVSNNALIAPTSKPVQASLRGRVCGPLTVLIYKLAAPACSTRELYIARVHRRHGLEEGGSKYVGGELRL